MRTWRDFLKEFLHSEDGPTTVEYAVMLSMIILVCFVAVSILGRNASSHFSNVALTTAIGGGS